MGIGDEIMASAQARHVHTQTGQKVDFGEYHPQVWKGNPIIARQRGGIPVRNRTGDRPYVLLQTPERVIFSPNYHAMPGEIHFNKSHLKDARGFKLKDYILVEPHTKKMFSKGNKEWPWEYWVELVKKLDNVVQLLPNKETKKLPNAKHILTDNVMVAFAILKDAKLLITTDGALHHAAAATYYDEGEVIGGNVPAIVIWTGFSHPKTLGYQTQINIRANDSEPCGAKQPCKHCNKMARQVPVDLVYEEYLKIRI